jgi:parvulin-like peptidyl-prolyl isomerase
MTIEVNGQPILPDAISTEIIRLQARQEGNAQPLTVDQRIALREAAVESLIDRILLYQEARRLDVMPSDNEIREACIRVAPRMDGVAGCRAGTDLEQLRKDVERQLVIDRLVDHWSRNIKPPRHSEIRDFYRKNRDDFWTAELVRASHVVRYLEGRNAEEERLAVERMRGRLLSQEPFAEVARQYSDCPENGGDLGYFSRGIMVEEFDAVVFATPLNEVTSVFETRFGFHVALVEDRKGEGIRTLNEVAPHISQVLMLQKKDREIGHRLDALRRKASITRVAR